MITNKLKNYNTNTAIEKVKNTEQIKLYFVVSGIVIY